MHNSNLHLLLQLCSFSFLRNKSYSLVFIASVVPVIEFVLDNGNGSRCRRWMVVRGSTPSRRVSMLRWNVGVMLVDPVVLSGNYRTRRRDIGIHWLYWLLLRRVPRVLRYVLLLLLVPLWRSLARRYVVISTRSRLKVCFFFHYLYWLSCH